MLKKRFLGSVLLISFAFCAFLSAACADQAVQKVQAGDIAYSLVDYRFQSGNQTVVPTAGNQFLVVNISVQNVGESDAYLDPARCLMAVDGESRIYAPVLSGSVSALMQPLKAGEKGSAQVVFEVPAMSGTYDLAVLTQPLGTVAGKLTLGRSLIKSAAPEIGETVLFEGQEYRAFARGAVKTKTYGIETAPAGMAYILLDVTLGASHTNATVAQLVQGWALEIKDGQTAYQAAPIRAAGLLSNAYTGMNELFCEAQGKLCFLAPENAEEISGIVIDGQKIQISLPLQEKSQQGVYAAAVNGSTYQQASWKVTVHSVRFDEDGKLAAPPVGSKYMIVNLTVENGSFSRLILSSELAFAMLDDHGAELPHAWFADLNGTLDAEMAPLSSITGEVAFVVDDEAKVDALRVHLNMLGEPFLIPIAEYIKSNK